MPRGLWEFNGSHRKGENTAAILRLVPEGLERGGVEAELLQASGLNTRFFGACNRCLMKTYCSIRDDDVPRVAETMTASDAILTGSPVYFGHVTSMLKALMDRTRWMRMRENPLDGRLGAAYRDPNGSKPRLFCPAFPPDPSCASIGDILVISSLPTTGPTARDAIGSAVRLNRPSWSLKPSLPPANRRTSC